MSGQDIRKWFMKQHDSKQPEKSVPISEESSGRRKTSKYFADLPVKRKADKVEEEEDFAMATPKRSPSKKLKSASGTSIAKKSLEIEESNKPLKPAGRGPGSKKDIGFNFGERKDPPHKGEKEIPQGAPNCLTGLTFVISGTLDSLEREEAEDLIKRHGGRVTGSVSKKTNYLLCDEDIGGRKSEKATELGTTFLTEDGLFEMISKSNKSVKKEVKKEADKIVPSPVKKTPLKSEMKPKSEIGSSSVKKEFTPTKQGTTKTKDKSMLSWTDKYKPKVSSDIIGNPGLVKQLHDWLVNWNEQFLNTSNKGKKKQNDPSAKKAVLLCGTPGIGKTTSAKLVSQMLGFQAIEVNASDNRGKANAKIEKGIGGSRANSVKELVSNQSLGLNMKLRGDDQKTVLIMDEVDGMSAGDRGGVADLIASIKMSKVPIICICNDRYSQKLKSLINYCLLLSYRKPTKQQMAKRLMQVASAEGLKVNEIALEELADRVNGDMRMAINQLQYMSLSNSVIGYDDIRKRLQTSSKDEDISPFTAVDKLFTSDKLRMDQKIDLSMSDADLVPLLIQENYINHRPRSLNGYDKSNKVKQTENELKHLSLLAKAAESIADGDIVNVQIRRYQQWQLSQTSVLASCIIPSTLLNGQRTVLEQGERNFNRFGSWLGKNSTTGKNYRILEDLHVHLLASRESYLGRKILRLDYITLLKKELTDPLRLLPKDEAVEKVINFMDSYSISMDDYDSIMEISKFQGQTSPLDGILPAVKSALTRGYNKGSKSRVIKTADLINLPGIKKAPKKRVAAMLEQVEQEEKLDNNEDDEEEDDDNDDSDAEVDSGKKLQSDLQSLNSKGIQVEMELKGSGNSSGKKTSASRGKGSAAQGKRGGSSSTATATGSASKRKR